MSYKKWQNERTFDALLRKLQKSLKFKSQTQKSTIFKMEKITKNYVFFRSCDFICNFLPFSQNGPEYIDTTGHFVCYESWYTSNFFFELHLDDVLEVLLVVGRFTKKCLRWLFHKWRIYLSFGKRKKKKKTKLRN